MPFKFKGWLNKIRSLHILIVGDETSFYQAIFLNEEYKGWLHQELTINKCEFHILKVNG